MATAQNTVFISYRRTNWSFALAVAQNLEAHGFDVFMDYKSIKSGDFSQIIFNSIESRAHFLVMLTPSALERCHDPNDWMRREMEHAIRHQRNIVPLIFEGFRYEELANQLPPELAAPMSRYNALLVVSHFFEAAMERLRTQFLSEPIALVPKPPSSITRAFELDDTVERRTAVPVEKTLISAETYFERGIQHGKAGRYMQAIEHYTQTIQLKPNHIWAYNYRGIAYRNLGNLELAITDHTLAIEFDPEDAKAYFNRGIAHRKLGNYDAAIRDYDCAIELDPHYVKAYNNRGAAYKKRGDHNAAIRDFSRAIELDPDYAIAYNNLGLIYELILQEYTTAVEKYKRALEIDPSYTMARKNLTDAIRKRDGRR